MIGNENSDQNSGAGMAPVSGGMDGNGGIVLDRAVVRYGAQEVIRDGTLQAVPGQVTAICGPNGCGKSTLLRAIAGLLPIHSGSIQLAGKSSDELSPSQRAQTIAWVPQQSALRGGLDVASVVGMGRYAKNPGAFRLTTSDHAAVDAAMQQCDVQHLAQRPVLQLSGGERARVFVARALATEAPLICLDEPTASLDIGHALSCLQLCRDLAAAGKTIIVVLHRLDEVDRFVDAVTVIDQGRTLPTAAPDQALDATVLARVWGVQRDPAAPDRFQHAVEHDDSSDDPSDNRSTP